MTFKTKLFSAILSAFAVLTFSTFVSAQDVKPETQPETRQKQERRMKMGKRDGFRNKKRGGGFMRGLQALNLSEDQKTQIRAIMDGNKNSFQANREEMKTIMQAKRDGTITPEQQERLNAFKAQMKEDAKRTHDQILGILTPEQRAQYEKNKEEMKRQREERRQLRDQNRQMPKTEDKKDNDN